MAERKARQKVAWCGRLLVVIMAIGLLAGACDRTGTPAPATIPPENFPVVAPPQDAVPGGAMSYAVEDETNGWNPSLNEWAASGLTIARTIFDTLTVFDSDKHIQPFLLESFTPNTDYTQWTLKLRPGIKFSNGKPVTAEAVVRDQTYLQHSPVLATAYSGVESFTATDLLTIDVKLNTPDATFPMMLSTQVGVVADPDWLLTNDSLNPVGTGPFVLQSWDRGDKLVVTRNPSYWRSDTNGARLPYLDRIVFKVMPDPTSRAAALENGDVDAIQSTDTPTTESFKGRPDWHIYTDPATNAKQMVMLNTQAPPFDDIEARQALVYATDVKAYQKEIGGGSGVELDSPFGPNSPWHVTTNYPSFNQSKARELVAHIKDRYGSFAFTLSASNDPVAGAIAQFLQRQWAAVGVDVTLNLEPLAKQIIKVITGGYQAQVWLQFDAADPSLEAWWWDQTYAVAPPALSLNFARTKDERIGQAIAKARSTSDQEVQRAAWAELQQRLAVDLPYIWLGEEPKAIIAGNNVVNIIDWRLPDGRTGLGLTQGGHPLAQAWIRPR